MEPLRLLTYMVPAVPLAFYETVREQLARQLGPVTLAVDSTRSGPELGGGPLADGTVDLAFGCSLAVLELAAPLGPGLHVLAAAVPAHARAAGLPRYWSDVVVRAEHPAQSFAALAGAAFAYNDPRSLSGLWGVAAHLASRGLDWSHFGRVVGSGGHHRSLELLLSGEVDAAAIDSIVLERVIRERPELADRVRRVTPLGPYPSPPLVARTGLSAEVRLAVQESLLAPSLAAALEPFGFAGFQRIDGAAYEACRDELERGLALGPPPPG